LNDEENNKLVATSNDEIGDLCKAYNEIEELTKNNQDMLIEKERLASLGQMIGGIAHNLKTPIFSISGGLEGLSDLIKEFDSSIEDPTVNDKDMHDIANDMKDWIIKLKEHVSYMSDVITAVKGQAVALSENNSDTFNIDELFKYVDILMKHELKNSLTDLNIENDVDNSVNIVGNINGLVQVINNIISNSIEAYTDEKNKIINLKASLSENKIIISIQDFGPGLDDEVKEKLFKEMITTKGKNGTGLGLFMSYSNIKAHYNGDLYFESTKGKGSTFYIEIPIQNQ
jgi:signal transduction histidine kinase